MVDQSDLAWRLLVRQHGSDLAFSQMMHAKNFVNDKKYRGVCIDWDDYGRITDTPYGVSCSLDESGARSLEKNMITQLAGDDPETLIKAGKYLEHSGVAAIDLNLGCPQKIAKRGNYGAYLLPQTDRIVAALSAMVQNLDIPITCKIRRLPSDDDTLRLVEAIEKTGMHVTWK